MCSSPMAHPRLPSFRMARGSVPPRCDARLWPGAFVPTSDPCFCGAMSRHGCRKIEDGAADATLLALAGLKRLGLADLAMTILPMDEFLPAVGQGAVCIETRQDDTATRSAVESIAHRETAIAVDMERAFLAELDGSCRTPIAGYCRIVDGAIDFRGMILRPDGSQLSTRRAAAVPSVTPSPWVDPPVRNCARWAAGISLDHVRQGALVALRRPKSERLRRSPRPGIRHCPWRRPPGVRCADRPIGSSGPR